MNLKEQTEDLIRNLRATGLTLGECLRDYKCKFIEASLRDNRGNCCKAAKQLGMHRNTLSRTLEELGIDANRFRPGRQRRMHQSSNRPRNMERTSSTLTPPWGYKSGVAPCQK